MTIRELRILPAFAIGRVGSAKTPVEAYTLEEDAKNPLNFRHIKPDRTLIVDEKTGEITDASIPSRITFKEDGHIRPVAPFLDVFAITSESDDLVPLTCDLLKAVGATAADVSWSVSVANRKVFRRTADENDIVSTSRIQFSDHEQHQLIGYCRNFIKDGSIAFGHVRYIKPNARWPEIRLRFTPAQGLIYGPNRVPEDPKSPKIPIPDQQAIYDAGKEKSWFGFQAPKPEDDPFFNETFPPALFANQALIPVWLNDNIAVSRGYLDDACDGTVRIELCLQGGKYLTASARICAAPPIVAPDVLFVRTLLDDLEQVLFGRDVPHAEDFEVTRRRAEEIVRRAAETVRCLNLTVMNGNVVKGLAPLSLDTMPAEEAFGTQRMLRPIMAENTVDTLTVVGLHEEVFAALRGGAAPWFLRLLRQPEEAADFTDRGRRKMPAMMCGADGNYLALTYRQINTLGKIARRQPSDAELAATPKAAPQQSADQLIPRNRLEQLQYIGTGNPISSNPTTAVGNCCPGLEVDFRAVWRRMLDGIELREYDNVVMEVTDPDPLKQALKGQRLLRVDGKPVVTQMLGPSPSNPKGSAVVATFDNPSGVAPLEWSNAFARTLFDKMGEEVLCDFTAADLTGEQKIASPQLWGDRSYPPAVRLPFTVRHFFDLGTVVISDDLAKDGELTQGLCSPWQNDYRECSCYYWAASRPDFVNVVPSENGVSIGDNWLQKKNTRDYVPDDYVDSRLVLYEDLFKEWEKWLRFHIGGKNAETGKDDSADCIS